ncbi:MAG TPA: pyridoxamine 5'-phosphate oxidase family protein [Longimicrobiales bacterium]
MRTCLRAWTACAALLLAAALAPVAAQEARPAEKAAPAAPERQKLLDAARQIMTAQTYCAFITADGDGRPQVRTVNPFPPEEDMTVWFATGIQTRKVAEIRANPHVAVYYADHKNATGYVQLSGRAVLVSDKAEIDKRRRGYWAQAFPGDKNLVLVKVIPERLDVVNYAAGVNGDKVTWRAPSIELTPKK